MFQGIRNVMRKCGGRVAVAGGALVPAVAMATDPTGLGDLTGGISLATAVTAVLSVALLIVGFRVMKQGAIIVLDFITKAK